MSQALSSLPAVEAMQATSLMGLPQEPPLSSATSQTGAPTFADWIGRQVEQLNGELLQAERVTQTLASGGAVNVHEVMLQMEQARLSMQLAVQVRTRVLDAYQEVMRLQV